MKFKQFIFSLFLVCAGWGIVAPVAVHAAVYTMAPRIIDLKVKPRDILEEKIVLTNSDSSILTLFPSVNTVSVGLEGGVEEFISPSMSDRSTTLTSWLETNRVGVEIKPGESRDVPLTIRVDPNAKPGVYHALISYAPGRTIDEATALIKAGGAPGTLINVTIEESKNESASLKQFFVKKFITAFHIGDASYRVLNSGDTEITPHGDILITNQRGEEVASVELNPEKKSVKPGEEVVFSAGVPVDGLLGKYKAFLTLQYGSGQAAVYDTAFFYIFPWKKVLIGFGVFTVSMLALVLWFHHRLSSRDDDEDAEYIPVTVRDTVSKVHHKDVRMK